MRKLFTALLAVSLAFSASAQEAQGEKSKASLSEPILISLSPGELKGPLAPHYSPPGTKAELKKIDSKLPGFDHLSASYKLGPQKDAKVPLVLARSAKDKPYDTLFIDTNGYGKLSTKPIKVEPKELRGKLWSTFEVVLKVDYAKTSLGIAVEDYPVSIWVVAEKAADTPTEIRLSRRGYMTGNATIDGKKYVVVLSDANNDGVYSAGDWWELRPAEESGKSVGNRVVGDFHWAGEKAYSLEVTSTNGKTAKLKEVKAGLTRAEDDLKRDILRADKMAARAAKPVPFRKEVDVALKEAHDGKKFYFLDFETEWCGPCKTMNELVYTAKDVVESAERIVCIKVDGDERKDLVDRYAVKGYPTGVLFDPEGKEIARFTGYQSVKELTAFFKKSKGQ